MLEPVCPASSAGVSMACRWPRELGSLGGALNWESCFRRETAARPCSMAHEEGESPREESGRRGFRDYADRFYGSLHVQDSLRRNAVIVGE